MSEEKKKKDLMISQNEPSFPAVVPPAGRSVGHSE